jgi:hypothetical protein
MTPPRLQSRPPGPGLHEEIERLIETRPLELRYTRKLTCLEGSQVWTGDDSILFE